MNQFWITCGKYVIFLLTTNYWDITLGFDIIPGGLHSEHPSVLYSSLGFDPVLEQCLLFSSALKGVFILLNVFRKPAHCITLIEK